MGARAFASILTPPFRARARLPPPLQVLDQRAQRPRRLAPLRVVEVVARERRAELLEDRHELAGVDRVAHVALERERHAEPGDREPTAERALLDIARTKWRWMAEKQADSLAALFHEDAVFVHMGGAWGKKQEVEIIRSGGIHYRHVEVFESSARIIGNTGIVLSRIRLDAVVGGNEVSNPFLVTEVYVRQGTTWKLGSLSFTRLLTPE